MKSNSNHIILRLLTILLLLVTVSGYSQKAITWKGGFPGKKNDWFCAQNWSTSSVPDEFSNVIIPDVTTSTFAPPMILSGKVEINSLNMLDNASLTLTKGAILIVNDIMEGVTASKLKGEGKVIREAELEPVVVKLFANQ
jgi:hypothetical protein